MNQYPAWKYLLIVLVLLTGVLYALPNLFGEDPALQVTSARGFAIPLDLEANIEDALVVENLDFKNKERVGNRMLYRFNSTDDQLRASDVIKEALGEQYVVALNLAHATPTWLRAVGGKPMTLGLDLQGGVHFLMQVDMETARGQQLDRYVDDLRTALRDERIRYVSVRREGNGLLALLRSVEDRNQALELIRRDQSLQGLIVDEKDTAEYFGIEATVQEAQLLELQKTALQQNITTLRNRVNEIGVAEPVIQQQGADRVVVQLPGVQDTVQAKKIIGATATLEYRAVDEANDGFTAAQTGRVPPESRLYNDAGGQPILLKKRLIVAGDQLIGASSGFDQQTGQPQVSVTLDGVGAKRMLDFTRDNVGNRMAVVYIEQKPGGRKTEEVISVAVVREPFGKRFQTTGLDSMAEASQLALLLRAGALAAPMEIVEERTVGPSLGADNVEQGFKSVMIGFILVLIFMAAYYRVFGLVADMALFANLVLLMALLSMLGATLTMPGIAGIVLTVGMAVDANVLIFERIREELRSGNTPQASIRAGYDKAFSTIADANITTLIAAFVLFLFGTGPIKGFAVTLSLGIVTSMFTAIMGTRAVINLIYGGQKRVRKLSI
ncbi:MAG: protein translocase subunit SecD [Xanthomonadales bacterium]|nr:protein translocase subunit SecD [Gammaproteobacteria bacterium]MBT8053736.1 protein translocase subunit SecD [Gammaproteobacteria bacterium]NND56749.1 protein translocase subunit SecD [Xanthomonadales bacterium]NNK50955.1 protein translocase subunit SecD [Xanthomonadales bacterium]